MGQESAARRQRGERPLRRRADLLGAPPHPDDRLGAAGVKGTVIPSAWPKHRYDVVWTFTLVPDAATTQYAFGQIPQLLLSGDSDTVIPAEGLTPGARRLLHGTGRRGLLRVITYRS